jgi:putative membrane protein
MNFSGAVLVIPLLATSALVAFAQGSGIPHSDASFLKDAAAGGFAEVKLGELAQQNAASDRVKEFGRKMIDDHSRMGEQVKSLAANKRVDLPTDMGIKEKIDYKLLSSKKGADFDRAYMAAMVKDHENDVAQFEKEADNGKDGEVRALASKALPTLRQHLQMAQDVAGEVEASAK